MEKKKLKTFSLVIVILLVSNIPFLLYLLSFRLAAFDEAYYRSEFQKYGVYSQFPGKDIDEINSNLLHYLMYDKTNNFIESDFFSQREKEHLLDVKRLVQFAIRFFYIIILNIIILLAILACTAKKLFGKIKNNLIKPLSTILIWGGILTLVYSFMLWYSAKINFMDLFTKFHQLFFKPGSWIFDTNIVKLYNQSFFYDIAAKIVLNTLIMALIIIVIGLLLSNPKIKKYINQRKEQLKRWQENR